MSARFRSTTKRSSLIDWTSRHGGPPTGAPSRAAPPNGTTAPRRRRGPRTGHRSAGRRRVPLLYPGARRVEKLFGLHLPSADQLRQTQAVVSLEVREPAHACLLADVIRLTQPSSSLYHPPSDCTHSRVGDRRSGGCLDGRGRGTPLPARDEVRRRRRREGSRRQWRWKRWPELSGPQRESRRRKRSRGFGREPSPYRIKAESGRSVMSVENST